MKRINNWLKKKIANWLGLVTDEELKILKSLVRGGVDFHPYSNGSWAAVCIHGKPDYIQFAQLKQGDIRGIHDFLKSFDIGRGNVVIDTPPHFSNELFF